MANIRQALLVEDREAVATELESLLSKLGFKVTTIQEPESVAQILESREYEVALMNMTLPGMNWRRTMLTVKSAARTTTIIAVKESPDEDDMRLALNAGSYVALERPLRQDQLANLIAPENDGIFVALR